MNKKVLFVRTPPYDLDMNSYNIQQVGLGKAICRAGYDFDFITFKKKNQREWVFYEEDGHKAKYIEKPRFRFIRMGINLSLCDKEFLDQYDLIISQEYYQIMTYLLSRKSDKVVMYNGPYYNIFMFKFMSPVYDLLFTKKINDQIKHKFVKSVLAEDFLCKKGYKGVHNIGVALDTDRFDNEQVIKPETMEVINYMKLNKCILYVGALSDRKNYPFMLKLYAELLKEEPTLKFVMIGKSKQSTLAKVMGKKDETYEETCNQSLPESVRNGIFRVNKIDNPQLKFIYPLAKAFLLPSKQEIFGMVLLEAMYLGAPVVTSRNGGSLTLIENGYNGFRLDSFDLNEWKKYILKLIRDPDLTKTISENAIKKVRDEYNWDVLAAKFLNCIEEDYCNEICICNLTL